VWLVACGKATSLQSNALRLFNTAKLTSFTELCGTKSQAILILHTNGKLPATGIHSAKRNLSYFLYIFYIFYAKPPLSSRFQPSLIKQINLESTPEDVGPHKELWFWSYFLISELHVTSAINMTFLVRVLYLADMAGDRKKDKIVHS